MPAIGAHSSGRARLGEGKARMNTIEWKDWEIFCRVVEGGGFTKGAELADVSKSSVSTAVSRLETQLGARLLERTTRHVRVTERGRQLYDRVAPLFAELHEIGAEAMSMSEQVSGTLRIATPYEVGSMDLLPSLTRLMRLHPGLHVEIDVTWAQPDLVERGYDLVFVMTKAGLHASVFASKRVVLIERGFFASPALIRARGLPRTPQDLASWPTVGTSEDRRWEFMRGGTEVASVAVDPRIRTQHAEIRLKAALDGLGVVRFARRYIQDELDQGRLVQLMHEYTSSPYKVYVLMPARKLMPASVRAFLDVLEETLGSDDPMAKPE